MSVRVWVQKLQPSLIKPKPAARRVSDALRDSCSSRIWVVSSRFISRVLRETSQGPLVWVRSCFGEVWPISAHIGRAEVESLHPRGQLYTGTHENNDDSSAVSSGTGTGKEGKSTWH